MLKKVIVAGLLGGLVLFAWTFAVNGILGFRNSIDRRPIPDERQVHECLKGSIREPGRYICNPEPTLSGTFPGGEPVYSIIYSGMGHDAAGRFMLTQLGLFFLAPLLGAWLLSCTSERVLASYRRKVFFFAAIGLLFAVSGTPARYGIDSYPLADALVLAAYDLITWTLVGLVVAWRIQPETDMVTHAQPMRPWRRLLRE
jgi:hypothetical protein